MYYLNVYAHNVFKLFQQWYDHHLELQRHLEADQQKHNTVYESKEQGVICVRKFTRDWFMEDVIKWAVPLSFRGWVDFSIDDLKGGNKFHDINKTCKLGHFCTEIGKVWPGGDIGSTHSL